MARKLERREFLKRGTGLVAAALAVSGPGPSRRQNVLVGTATLGALLGAVGVSTLLAAERGPVNRSHPRHGIVHPVVAWKVGRIANPSANYRCETDEAGS